MIYHHIDQCVCTFNFTKIQPFEMIPYAKVKVTHMTVGWPQEL